MDRMLCCGKPAANGKRRSERKEGGRRIQLKKNDITCAAIERRGGRREGGNGRWHRKSKRKWGDTEIDGLAAEQMWMREGGKERENVKDRRREEREGASLLISW